MTVKELQNYLSKFTPKAEVQIWEWNNPQSGDNIHHCNVGCNYEYQQEHQVVQLMRGFPITNET